jgi:hypothetical protein
MISWLGGGAVRGAIARPPVFSGAASTVADPIPRGSIDNRAIAAVSAKGDPARPRRLDPTSVIVFISSLQDRNGDTYENTLRR